ncbi:MAG: HAMP domain-containing protein [candidate division NC10 bacterium]|nr:HAMP domain-containing protein [candidate division NC10 bacterium]
MSKWAELRNSLAITFTSRIFGFVSLVVLGVVGYLLVHEQRVLEQELQNRGLLMATHLAQQSVDPILREDDYALFKLVRVLRETDSRGQALAHTDPSQVHAVLTDPRTRQILARPDPSVTWIAGPTGERLYDVAVPIRMRGLPVGAVRLGMSRAGVDQMLRDLALKVLAVLFVLMLVGIGSIWRFSRRMVHPIQRLRDSARAVQAGDLSQRVAVDRADEIGQLALAFNAMTTELARSHDELARKEQMRARLLEQVITAQEDERKRIARELHDETSQALTSLMVGLKLLEQRPELAEMRESLADLRALTGKTLDAVHDLALQLRPSVLDDLGLVPAVDRIVEEFRRTHGIRVTFETNLRVGPRLPASLETALYRITQEALTNVARHAGAQSVSLLLEARRGSVRLIVEDDGRGFDVASCMSESREERCLGVFGMRERATLLGGTLTVESAPGNGTTVFVEVPLPLPLTGYPLGASPPSEGERNG